MVGATTGGAGMMAVLNPVPLGRRQSLHSDGQHRTGAMSGRSDFRFRALMHLAEMEAAIGCRRDALSYRGSAAHTSHVPGPPAVP